jgi:hypothetical protein
MSDIAMQRLWMVTLFPLAALVCLGAGFWLGLHAGADYGEAFRAPSRGVLATRALADLSHDQPRAARLLLEEDVDQGLLCAHDLLASPLRIRIGSVLGPGTSVAGIEADAIDLATYRKANASPFHDQYLVHDPKETSEDRAQNDAAARRHDLAVQAIASMVQRYARK